MVSNGCSTSPWVQRPSHRAPAARRLSATAARSLPTRVFARGGFTILELLVVISIVAILTSLLMPALSKVRDAGGRIHCASNMRQVGCALFEYSEEHRDRMPPLDYTGDNNLLPKFGEAMALTDERARFPDGLGRLVIGLTGTYLKDPRILYCPCHQGDHPFSKYAPQLTKEAPLNYRQVVYCNYHYRGTMDPVTHKPLPRSVLPETVLLVDGLRTQRDFSHRIGTNRLKADGSVDWRADTGGWIYDVLPSNPNSPTTALLYETVWKWVDDYKPTEED